MCQQKFGKACLTNMFQIVLFVLCQAQMHLWRDYFSLMTINSQTQERSNQK